MYQADVQKKKQQKFRDSTMFPREMSDCRNSILMTCHYPDQGSVGLDTKRRHNFGRNAIVRASSKMPA